MWRILSLSLLLLASTNNYAMRCAFGLISSGDLKYDVERKCGQPLSKDAWTESTLLYDPWGFPNGEHTVTYERWVYQRSSADFRYELIFDGGRIMEIRTNRNPY